MEKKNLIIFDLFGVVFTKGLASSIEYLTDAFNKSEEEVTKVYRKWEIKFDLGLLDERDFWKHVNNDLQTNVNPKLLTNIVISSYQLKKETVLLIDYLKRTYPVVLCSNYRKEWFDILDKKHKVSKHFDRIYISSITKILKPASTIFDLIKKDFYVSPSDCILIDDEEPNINSFNEWGGHGIHFTNIYEAEVTIRKTFKILYPKYDDFYSGIILKTTDGTLVLQRRDLNKKIDNPGKLSVFGGRREAQESAKECAIRELYEETGLRISDSDLVPVYECSYPIENGNWMLCNYFLINDVDLNLINVHEGQGIEVWKPINALKQKDLTEIPKILIEKLLATKVL